MPSPIDLPWELWIKVLSFSDEFATLTSFSGSSKRNRDIVHQSRSLLHYRICLNIGYTEPSTFASAAPVHPVGYLSGAGQHESIIDFASGSCLADTINRQNTMMKSAFKHVKDWKEFAKTRYQIEKNWRAGKGRWSTICSSSNVPHIWRFKNDPEYNYWACVTLGGHVEVVSVVGSNRCRRWLAIPASVANSTHLESSGPFLVTNNHQDCFYVWKRIDESFRDGNLPTQDEAWPNHSTDVYDGAKILATEMHDSAPMFRFRHSLHMPIPAFCFKARAPYLVAGSYLGQRLYVWDLHTGSLVENYDTQGRDCDDMTYIDFDSDFVFLANSECIDVFDRQTRQKIFRIPPRPVDALDYYADTAWDSTWWQGSHNTALVQETLTSLRSDVEIQRSKQAASQIFFDTLTEWVAVHYDYKNGHLVALSQSGYLIWTPRYRQTLRNQDSIAARKDFVVLYADQSIKNLCVENGRAVFSTAPSPLWARDCPFESLYSLELKCWSKCSEFLDNPPKLTTIETVVPSSQEISRIEMDSGAIYVTATGTCLDSNTVEYEAWRILKRGYSQLNSGTVRQSWFDLDGKLLCRADTEERIGRDLPPSEKEWKFARRVRISHASAVRSNLIHTSVIAYSFAENRPDGGVLKLKWGRG